MVQASHISPFAITLRRNRVDSSAGPSLLLLLLLILLSMI